MISMLPTEKVKTGSVRMTRMNIELVAKIRNIILNSGPSIVLNLEEIYENFNEEGISYATMRKRCQRIRETIPRILDDWQKSEFIDDWSFLDYNVKGTPTSILVHNTHNYKCDYVLEEFAQYQINKSSKE
jgi:hypothetical protein